MMISLLYTGFMAIMFQNEYVLGSKAAITSDEMIIVGFSEYELRRSIIFLLLSILLKSIRKGMLYGRGKKHLIQEKLV